MRSPHEPFTRITAGLTLPSSGIMNLNPAKVLVLRDSRFHKSTPCGDVATFLYILKTSIGQEENVANEIRARLSGTGSLKDIQDEIFGVLVPGHVRGYIFVEASALHHVEKLIGMSGMTTTRLKNCRKVLPGVSPLENTLSYLEPKAATAGIEEGCIIEISGGAFKGRAARVIRVTESKESYGRVIRSGCTSHALTVRADQVRVTQRVE